MHRHNFVWRIIYSQQRQSAVNKWFSAQRRLSMFFNNWKSFLEIIFYWQPPKLWCAIKSVKMNGCRHWKKKPDQWSWFERTVDFSFRRRWRQSFSLSSQHPLNASTLEVKWNGDLQVKVEQFTRKWNSVIIYSPICWWNIVSSFVVHKTFLEPHSKTALLQHSPKQMKLMKTLIKQ